MGPQPVNLSVNRLYDELMERHSAIEPVKRRDSASDISIFGQTMMRAK